MKQYKCDFIEFMVECSALKFGDFTLKSGRKSPYFMNAGAYKTGSQLKRLGEFYAHGINETFGLDFDVLFGPAYKGIPLSVTTASAIYDIFKKDVRYCSNRKEIKDHGADAGVLLGSDIEEHDRVLIIEDVTTSGKSIHETYPIIKNAAQCEIVGLEVSLNRCEVAKDTDQNALEYVSEKYDMKTSAIVTIYEVIDFLFGRVIDGQILIDATTRDRMEEYLNKYGSS